MTILMSLKSNVQIRKNTYIISYQNERAAAWCFKLVQDPNQDAVEQKIVWLQACPQENCTE